MATKTTKTTKATEPVEEGFLKYAVELSHSWEVIDTKPLTKAEKEAIKSARVKQGKYGLQMSLSMVDGTTRVMNLSQFSPLEVGDIVRVNSISIDQLYDSEEDKTIYRINGEAL